MKSPMLPHVLLATTALVLAGCAQWTGAWQPNAEKSLAEVPGESGVVIASSGLDSGHTLLDGGSTGVNLLAPPADCAGTPTSITAHSATSSKHLLLDSNGQPCGTATMLYDGRTMADQRAADPTIRIDLPQDLVGGHQKFVTTRLADNPADLPELPALPAIRVQAEPLGTALGNRSQTKTVTVEKTTTTVKTVAPATDPSASLAALDPAEGSASLEIGAPGTQLQTPISHPATTDHLTELLSSWKNTPATPAFATSNGAGSSDEATSAAMRALDHTAARQHSEAAMEQNAQLLTQLREKERQLQEEQRRHAQTEAMAIQQKSATAAMLSSFQQQQQQTDSQLAATKEQLQTAEAANQHLAQVKAEQEQAYTSQVQALSKDLKATEQQASSNRNALVMAAAQKIAEAESLANAARLAEADATAREAARKKQEGEDLMQRALDLKNNQAVILAANTAPSQLAQMALLEVPVVLHVKDQPLGQILDEILRQAGGQAGQWKADWQLTAAQQAILQDKWSLTAEAPVSALLQNLTAQVKAARGITLKFTQFAQSRLVVVTAAGTDSPALAANPAPASVVPALPAGITPATVPPKP